jgi:hypothetical protein
MHHVRQPSQPSIATSTHLQVIVAEMWYQSTSATFTGTLQGQAEHTITIHPHDVSSGGGAGGRGSYMLSLFIDHLKATFAIQDPRCIVQFDHLAKLMRPAKPDRFHPA